MKTTNSRNGSAKQPVTPDVKNQESNNQPETNTDQPPVKQNLIFHNNSSSAYDRTAMQFIYDFLNRRVKSRVNILRNFIKRSGQNVKEYNAILVIHPRFRAFRKTAEEAYQDALNWDVLRPSYIRIWAKDNTTHYICAPETDIFGGYVGEEYGDDYWLKQEVKDLAVKVLKEDLLIED